AHWGMGQDRSELPAENSKVVRKLLYVFEIFYVINIMTIKISILIMYRRIFTNLSKTFRVGSFICGSFVILWALAFVPTAIFQCTPVSKAWDIDQPGHCISLRIGFFCVALPNVLTDIAILSLPIQVCWQLQTRKLYRTFIIGIFMLGTFVIGVSIYRFTTLFIYSPHNVTGTIGPATLWSVIECAVAIICACLPLLVPLVRRVSHWFGCSQASNANQNRLGAEDDNSSHYRPRKARVARETSRTEIFPRRISALPGFDTQTFENYESSAAGSTSTAQNNETEMTDLEANYRPHVP
ncbi:hypothetical protein UA08_03268, partial [Talaromyces atroroseus]